MLLISCFCYYSSDNSYQITKCPFAVILSTCKLTFSLRNQDFQVGVKSPKALNGQLGSQQIIVTVSASLALIKLNIQTIRDHHRHYYQYAERYYF